MEFFLVPHKEPQLAALVLRKGYSKPEMVRLCLLSDLKSEVNKGVELYREGGKSIYNLIWRPLESKLEGARRIFYSPVGDMRILNMDAIICPEGDRLMSGSFIVSGQCHARLDRVGEDSYISKLTLQAKQMQSGEQSEMIRSLDKLVKCVGVAIIPIGLVLFAQAFFFQHDGFRDSVTSMIAAVIGMIPEGLYLLASVALAVSTVRLARKKVLLHDMKCIETLARVDVLCVDKTGTITENTMKVQDVLETDAYDGVTMDPLNLLIGDFAAAMTQDNITMAAVKEYFTKGTGKQPVAKTGFSSASKYSSVTFPDGAYVLGAPEFVLKEDYADRAGEITELASTGARVLVFGTYDGQPDGKSSPS